jgi:hypothetical protein
MMSGTDPLEVGAGPARHAMLGADPQAAIGQRGQVGTDAAGRLRGLFGSGRKRCRRSWLSRRYRPPSWVPNQIEPSGVVARLQTVLVPINGWLLRS